MGETGAGITAEDQIDMEKPNMFTNKWGVHLWTSSISSILTLQIELIRESSPWFFDMKNLISERPNVIVVGTGNSQSEINMSTCLAKSDDNGEVLYLGNLVRMRVKLKMVDFDGS